MYRRIKRGLATLLGGVLVFSMVSGFVSGDDSMPLKHMILWSAAGLYMLYYGISGGSDDASPPQQQPEEAV